MNNTKTFKEQLDALIQQAVERDGASATLRVLQPATDDLAEAVVQYENTYGRAA